MKENKCPNCGAGIKFSEDKSVGKCPYCGTTFKLPEMKEEIKYKTIKDLQIDEDEEDKDNGKINITILILLLIFCTPAAIIYLIINMLKK